MHVFLWVVLEISPLVRRGAIYVYVIGTEMATVFLAMIASLCLSCIVSQNFITNDILQ